MNYQSVQRATVKQAGCSSTNHSDRERIFSPQNAIKKFAIWAVKVKQHTHCEAHHMFSVARRIQVVFKNLSLRWNWQYLLWRGSSEHGWKQTAHLHSHLLPRFWLIVKIPCISGVITSGHFADTHFLTRWAQPKRRKLKFLSRQRCGEPEDGLMTTIV